MMCHGMSSLFHPYFCTDSHINNEKQLLNISCIDRILTGKENNALCVDVSFT